MMDRKPVRDPEDMTDEELATIDEYHDPAYGRPSHKKRTPPMPSRYTTEPRALRRVVDNDEWWMMAAAFGDGPADCNHTVHVRYMDALDYLAARPAKQDRRVGPRGHKTQATVGDTMRRKIGGERYASA